MKTGRPTKYNQDYARQVLILARLGATNPDLAEFFQVSISTIKKWAKEEEEFSAARKEGRQKPLKSVEASFLQKAQGFYVLKNKSVTKDSQGKTIQTVIQEVEQPPSVGACIFYLKNMAPAKYKGDMKLLHEAGSVDLLDELQTLIAGMHSKSQKDE